MRILIGGVTLLALLVVGLLVAPSFIDWGKYKQQGQEQIKNLTGYDVIIDGDFSLAFLPAPHVNAKNVRVINPAVSDDPIAAFEALSVSVALMPLLKGAVQVSDVELIKPVIDLRVDSAGKGNWLSPEVEAMLNAKGEQQAREPSSNTTAVSFDEITIEKGAFRFADAAKGSVTEINDIDLELEADSLTGPFDVEGAAVFAGKPITFDAEIGELDDEAQSALLKLEAEQEPYAISYNGIFAYAAPFEAQGEIDIRADDVPGLGQALALTGNLAATPEAASVKGASLKVGDYAFAGAAEIGLKPMNVKAEFASDDVVNLDRLLPKSEDSKGGDLTAVLDILPKTITLPQDANGSVALKVGGVVFNKEQFQGVNFTASKQGRSFEGKAEIANLPGNGPAVIRGDLAFSDVSASSSGAQVFSDPTLNIRVQANSQNTGALVKALSGQTGIPVISQTKIGKFDLNAAAVPGRLTLKESVVNLDDLKLSLAGSMKRGEQGRALLGVDVQANALNFDDFTGKKQEGAAEAGGSPTDALQALSLPFDVDFDVAVNDAVMNGQSITGLQAVGSLRPDTLSLTKLGASDFGGASFNVSGKVGSLKALSGLDLTVQARASDPYKVAKTFDVDTAAWPQNIGAVAVNTKASGSLTALNTQTNVNAFGGDFVLQGAVQNPLTALSFSDLALQIKHSNMAQLLSNVGASAPEYASFQKPIDFYTKLDTDGKITTLSGIKATFAGTNMNGSLRYDGSAAKPSVSGDLKFGRLELVSARGGKASGSGASAGASGTASSGGASASSGGGKWSSDPLDTGFLHAVNADFNVAAESLLYEKWDLKSPSLKVTLKDGTLNVSDLKAGVFNGQIAMTAKMASASPTAPLSLETQAGITDVNIGSLAYALSGTRRIQADGTASLSVTAAGQGGSQKALVSSLNGNAKLNGSNVVMKGFDLAGLASALLDSNKPVERIQQIVGASTSSGQTAFDTVNGMYSINSGVVNIDSMVMDGPEAKIVSTGNADLPRWYLDTSHTISLKNAPGVEPFDVAIKGSLNNPANTFGKGLFQTYYQQKLQEKIMEKAPDLLGDDVTGKLKKFGILPQARDTQNTAPAPANNNTAPSSSQDGSGGQQQQQAPKTKEQQQQEAIEGVIKGLFQ